MKIKVLSFRKKSNPNKMKIATLFSLITLLPLTGQLVFSQGTTISEARVKEIIHTNSTDFRLNKWQICNDDSSYFHSDTLVAYYNASYDELKGFCHFVEWVFEPNQRFTLNYLEWCREPPLNSTPGHNPYRYKIKTSKEKEVHVCIYYDRKLKSKYQFIEMEACKPSDSGEKGYKIKMVRK